MNRAALLLLAFALPALAEPSTRPADEAVDFLLDVARPATRPASQPATQPTSPLQNRADRGDGRLAVITLNNGQTLRGSATTTPDRPIRIWDEQAKDYRDIPLELFRSAEAKILWERDEPEWQFKESGSDIKVFTGKTYPARELLYTVTLINGETLTGGIVAPLYMDASDVRKIYVLHKRQKGDVGQRLTDLLFVQTLSFEDPTTRPAK